MKNDPTTKFTNRHVAADMTVREQSDIGEPGEPGYRQGGFTKA